MHLSCTGRLAKFGQPSYLPFLQHCHEYAMSCTSSARHQETGMRDRMRVALHMPCSCQAGHPQSTVQKDESRYEPRYEQPSRYTVVVRIYQTGLVTE